MGYSRTALEDRALWERACRGDEDAWEAMRDRFGPALTAVLLGRLEPAAVPGALDGILRRAHGDLRDIPDPSRLGQWLVERTRKPSDDLDREAALLEAVAGLDALAIAELLDLKLPEVEARLERGRKAVDAGALARHRYKVRGTKKSRRPLAVVAVLLAIAAAAFFIVKSLPEEAEGWLVAWVSGPAGATHLATGDTIETSSEQRARLALGEKDHVDVEPTTRARHGSDGGLVLERGALRVQVAALEIRTPSATVMVEKGDVVLECDEKGRGFVTVSEGRASLGQPDVFLPTSATCRLHPDGPGVPYHEDDPEGLHDVQAKDALSAALYATEPRHTLTLWHLVPRVDEDVRELLRARIAELVPPPNGEDDLAAWERALRATW